MEKSVVRNPAARVPSAPLSPGLVAGPFVFLSGHTGIDPSTEQLAGPDIEAQTRQIISNLGALLDQAGLGMSDVVKTTVFLTNVEDFQSMNAVYRELFPEPRPTRSTVIVAGLARSGCVVEIEAIALRPS